ncbi:hypothetical protein FGO68_gene11165 [Halteria grandinella]|uniref:Protein kinase domain-containing protein n=1 Tax=Halteria grandinella TaxID=5974 RepID=A0A8J8T657_HALGN|nr:hypothetical protein FGO68_gene11165 [Halteria grandinella]
MGSNEQPTDIDISDYSHADYDFEKILGQGAQGVVFQLRHKRTKEHFALKMNLQGKTDVNEEISKMSYIAKTEVYQRLKGVPHQMHLPLISGDSGIYIQK